MLHQFNEFTGQGSHGYGPDKDIFVDSYSVEYSDDYEPVSLTAPGFRGDNGGWGFYYLNLTEAFTGEDGYLTADYAQNDGIHLTVAGYSHWMDYLCTHVPYNKNNPYQQGSTYCLSDELRQLIADLP